MSLFNTQKMQTTEEILNATTERIVNHINEANSMRDSALSSFRNAANQLAFANTKLDEQLNNLANLASFIDEQSSFALKNKEDNEAVRQKILDIIGE